jgi:type IV pilus assembly protein PilC
MDETVKNIIKGEKISSSFKDHWAIPDIAYYMIVTGESTGQLAEMLQKVSVYYSQMHRSLVSNLKAFVEPILISLLAIVVGVIILAVIVPMFDMMNQLEA